MRRIITIAGALLSLLLLTPLPADAHSFLRESTPADGEVLDSPPSEVVLEFTEPPDLEVHSDIRVLDESGQEVGAGDLEPVGPPEVVRVTLPHLEDGVYTVSWRALSTVDGHVTAGLFAFGVGADPLDVVAQPGHGEEAEHIYVHRPTVLSVGGRWAFYWGLTLLMGTALAGLVMFGRPIRWAGVLTAAAWVVAAVGLVAMFIAELQEIEASPVALLGSERGRLIIGRAIPLALAGVVAIPAVRRGGRLWPALLGAITAVGMLVHSYAGHAGAPGGWQWARVGSQWIHIVAVGIWIGGLVWLLTGLIGEPLERSGPASRRFSALAAFALAGVAITGALRAWQEVGTLPALIDSGFGLTAVGKSVLFFGMIGLGAYNRYRMVPSMAGEQPRTRVFRRSIGGELLLAAGVFGLSGVMSGLAPPSQLAAAAAPAHVAVEGTDFAQTVNVRLTVSPGTPGLNRFDVRLQRFDSEEPMAADAVVLRFSHAERTDLGSSELEMEMEHGEEGSWTARGSNLSLGGTWRVGVRIQAGDASVEVPLAVALRRAEPRVEVIEGGPGEPTIYTIHLPDARAVQGYLDPGEVGQNEVHFTFFSEAGEELAIAEADMDAISHEGDTHGLDERRLSEGHFVASTDLMPGMWRFRVDATTEEGERLTAEFEQEVE